MKRSHGVNVHNLIQKIENHPQRHALQSDLQQHRAFNLFSKESQDVIEAAGNIELCEIVDVEPKAQCKARLAQYVCSSPKCVYMCVRPCPSQTPNAFKCVCHQMRLYVCHQMRLYVCHQMRLYVCHQMCLQNPQWSSLRSHVF